MKRIKAFTLLELLVAVALVGVLSIIAVYYLKVVPNAQALEAMKLIETNRLALYHHLENKTCTSNGVSETIKGKYGSLVVLGKFNPAEGGSCPTGCTLTYTFNSSGVSKFLAGKTIEAELLQNMKVSKLSSTTVSSEWLPKNFVKIPVKAGDNCSILSDTVGVSTSGGGTSGTETSDTQPTSLTPLPGTPPVESGGSFPSDPSPGGGGTAETTTPESTIDLSDPKNQPSNLVCYANTIAGGSSSWVGFCAVVNEDVTLEFGQALTTVGVIHDMDSVVSPTVAMALYIKKYRKCPETNPSDKLVWTSTYFGIIDEFLAKQPYVISPQPVFYRLKDGQAMLDAVQVAKEESPGFRLSGGNGTRPTCISGYVKPIPKR